MLDAGRPPERHGGLLLFFDHATDDLRYGVAETPRIVQRPTPRISLLLFRDDVDGGGFLQLESALAPTQDQLTSAQQELAAAGRVPTLTSPDWRTGTVEVAGWLETDELAPLSLAIGPPSLVGDPSVVLAARLDRAGASLADAALRGDALPTVLLWKLQTLGLSGPLGLEVEADLQAMHDRLTADGALTTPIGRARLAKTWESFERDHFIRVRVVDESGDVEGRRAEALRQVGEELTARMFRPTPPAEKPPQLDDTPVAAIELSFRLTLRREELAQTTRWNFTERRAVPISHYAGANLIGLLAGRPASAHIFVTDLGPLTREITLRVEPELASLGLAAVEVDLDFGGSGEVDRTFVLTDRANEQRLSLSLGPADTLRYRARARFDPGKTRAPDRASAWMEAAGDLVLVSPRRLFPPRTLTLVAGRVEFDWIDRVELLVAAPQEPERSVVLTGARRTAEAHFPDAGEGPINLTAHWRGLADEPSRSEPTLEVRDELIVLDSPFGDSIEVLAVPLPLSDVLTIALELRIEHEGFAQHKSLSWDGDDRAPRRAGMRRLRGSPRRYDHRVTLVRSDGTLDEGAWIETDEPTLVIGADEPVAVYDTEIVILGGGPAGRGSLAVELVLDSAGGRTRKVIEGEVDHARLVLVAPEDAPPPSVIAREFLISGQMLETRWPELLPLLVLPLPTPQEP